MAETSLARQLKKLSVPQTTILIQDKIRKSFLFDHRDAAGLDRELIFAYGTTGLQKLCIINSSFSRFEGNLFSLSYKDFERSVQNVTINQKLDDKITEFLRMLSPYFLMREAHEALEWLVYRFHVHLYNVDELIACALPHYNTSYFVRVVQLIDLDVNSRWLWLKSIQKTGVPLDYSAILNCFLSDASFRKFVCDIAANVLNEYKGCENSAVPVVSFSVLTIRNALEKCKFIDDKLLPSLLPYVLTGLSSNLNDYILGSYLIISEILLKVKLNTDVLNELLIKIFELYKEDLCEEIISILILIFQTQPIKVIPQKVYLFLISNDKVWKILIKSLNSFKATSLTKAVIKKTLKVLFNVPLSNNSKTWKKSIKVFQKIISHVVLEEKCVIFTFNCILKKYCKAFHDKYTNKNLKNLKKIVKYAVKNFEHKYPDHFDKAYKKFLENKHKSKKMLCKLVSNSVSCVKYNVVPDIITSLTLGLYHPNPSVRETSVEYLLKLLEKKDYSKNEFLRNSIYDRLLDDNAKIVLALLSSADKFINLLGKDKLSIAFGSIFSKKVNLNSYWYAVQMKCLEIIINHYVVDESIYDVLPVLFYFIFPLNEHTSKGFFYIVNSEVNDVYLKQFFACMKQKFEGKENDKNFDEMNHVVINCIEEFVDNLDYDSKVNFISILKSKTKNLNSSPLSVFFLYVMQFMLTKKSEDKDNVVYISDLLQVLNLFFCKYSASDLKDVLKFFKSCFTDDFKFSSSDMSIEKFNILYTNYTIEKYLHSLNKNKFPSALIFYTFFKIVTGMELHIECKSWPSLKSLDNSYCIASCLFDFCVIHLSSDREFLQEYFNIMLSFLISCQFKSIQTTFLFLSTKWLISENLSVKLASLSVAIPLMTNIKQVDWVFENPMIFLSIVKEVANPNDVIRHNALKLLHLCLLTGKNSVLPLKVLGEEIVSKSEEIKTDFKQCFSVVGLWLNSAFGNSFIKKSKHVEVELQKKSAVLNQFLSLLNNVEVPYVVKYFLLSCLRTSDNESILTSCIPVLYNHLSLLNEVGSDYEPILKIIHLLLKKFTAKTAVCLTGNSDVSKAFLYSLNFSISDGNDIGRQVQLLVLDVISKEFFSSIPSVTVQQEILEKLLSLYMSSSVNISANVEKVLRQVLDHAYLFLKHLKDQEIPVSKSATLREMKKVKLESSLNILESEVWKKIVVFLELIQSESSFVHKEILIPELFNLLNKSLDFDSQDLAEYIKQLILSAIHNCCEQFGSQQHLEQYFQVELIVQCIRSSANPKTHRQALLLLNLAAALFPDYVLKNVMSIFVFMGSSLIRQDNSYSFQVISQTIETVLPSLCEASYQQTKTDSDQVVASVIRVFVDSLLDIPGHRQLPLFTKLITTLDPSKYLWIPLGQICDQYATVFHNISSDDTKNWKVSPTLEFAVNLHKQFSPNIQIDTCIKLIDFLLMLPDSKKEFDQNPKKYDKIKEPFNVASHNDNELQIYKYNVLSYMKIWLSSQAFHSQVSELNVKEQSSLEEKYEQLLESVLLILRDRLGSKKNVKDCKNLNDQLQLLYDIVYAINSLLPCNLFIQVIRRLLKNDEKEIQLRAVELLSSKLEQQKDSFNAGNHKLLLKLLKPLLKIANTSVKTKDDNQYLDIQQTALYALHLLCKLIGSEYPGKFYKVLNLSVTILDDCSQPELVVNALLCLAQLCHCLNVDILPRLNTFMPTIICILQDDKILDMSECFVLGIATALHSIIENLGMFLSSYMEDIISSICIFSVKYSELGKKTVSEKFEKLQAKLANEIPLRILLPAIESSYLKLPQTNTSGIVPLMKILTLNLDASNYEDILSCAAQLQNLCMSLLDFRNSNLQFPVKIVNLVEDSIISSLKTFVLKLSVTRFRTFFQKLYQWAVVTKNDHEQKYRIFSFYKLTSEFSKSLKSLFSPMSKYLFIHISSTLDSCNLFKVNNPYFDCKNLSNELLINVIDTLNFCFMYAEEQLLDKENFDKLMLPIVNQLENVGDQEMYRNLVENHLSSCIAYFMTAVSDSALWKSLNYQILLKTRHESPNVRFAALQVILEVVKKMGDNYLVLLPESIPFLAEIMEDESSEVEQECKNVIVEMEKILGEPIQKYF